MKKHGILKWIFSFLLMSCLLFSPASAEEYTMTAAGKTYTVDLPEAYLPYTPEMGTESPMARVFGVDPSAMDPYMNALGCSMVCVHAEQRHEMWISVKDRSAGFSYLPEGTDPSGSNLEAYYLGVSVARGKYSAETYDGHTYWIFADGNSISEGGISYYISTFLGRDEVSVRWESGNGFRTESDMEEIKEIIRSIIAHAAGSGDPSAQEDLLPEENQNPDSSADPQEYYFAEVPAVLRLSEENLNICTRSVSPDSLTAKRLSERDKMFMDLEFSVMDYVEAFITYPDTPPTSFYIQIKIKDDQYPQMTSWDQADEAEIAAMMETVFEGQVSSYSVYRTETAVYTVFRMAFDDEALRYVTLKNGDLIDLHMKRQYSPLTDQDYELLKTVADSMDFMEK